MSERFQHPRAGQNGISWGWEAEIPRRFQGVQPDGKQRQSAETYIYLPCQVERQHRLPLSVSSKNVGMVVPADVEIGGRLGEQGAHGKKRRAFGVGQLKQTRRFSVHRDARARQWR